MFYITYVCVYLPGVINLDTPLGDKGNMFERNYKDVFIVEANDVGAVTSVR